MTSDDVTIINTAKQWLTDEKEVLLVTVIETWGSSPRPVGSMLLIRNNGEHVGSVSGGCIEEDLINKYQSNSLPETKVSAISYGVGQVDAQKFGLPCGGRLNLLLERISSKTDLSPIIECFITNTSLVRHVNVNTGMISFSQMKTYQVTNFDGNTLHKTFGADWQMLLIGANDLSQKLSSLASALNYKVIVCDPREIAVSKWLDDTALFITDMPDDAVKNLTNKQQSIVLGLTHDPKMDDMALMQALLEDFFYVGAIGSQKTQAARRKRLKQLDLTETQLDQLHGPIGLNIGSKQPMEIAISIMAELTQLRHAAELTSSTATDISLKTA